MNYLKFSSNQELRAYIEGLAASNPTEFCMKESPAVTELPPLPASITHLEIEDCPALWLLPKLPKSLSFLSLYKCGSLT